MGAVFVVRVIPLFLFKVHNLYLVMFLFLNRVLAVHLFRLHVLISQFMQYVV